MRVTAPTATIADVLVEWNRRIPGKNLNDAQIDGCRVETTAIVGEVAEAGSSCELRHKETWRLQCFSFEMVCDGTLPTEGGDFIEPEMTIAELKEQLVRLLRSGAGWDRPARDSWGDVEDGHCDLQACAGGTVSKDTLVRSSLSSKGGSGGG
jgi:hypothetical protein